MRWALVDSGKVVNVVQEASQPTIPGSWVACGNAGIGWSFDGVTFAAPPSAPFVPTVSRRQARRALLDAGLLASVESAINGLSEPAKSRARIDWEDATEFRRDWPLLVTLASALGLSDAQVDALFAAAALL